MLEEQARSWNVTDRDVLMQKLAMDGDRASVKSVVFKALALKIRPDEEINLTEE